MKNINKDSVHESYYSTLGVSRHADASEIRSAYKSLVADLDCECAEDVDIERSAKKAYSVLADKNLRMRYNNTLDAQAGYDEDEPGSDAHDNDGETAVTVYTIDSRGNWYTEKHSRDNLPGFSGTDAYVLRINEEEGKVVPKDLWNRWRDLCAIWRSKNAIKGSIGDICLDVDLISMKDGRLEYTKTLRKVSQLPLIFPKTVGELGKVYAYKNESGEVMLVEQYDWMHLRRIMEKQSLYKYENTGW